MSVVWYSEMNTGFRNWICFDPQMGMWGDPFTFGAITNT
jgi:hypothetical protein